MENPDESRIGAKQHQAEARKLHYTAIIIAGLTALSCIVGGIWAVMINAKEHTDVEAFGMRISTGSIGVAFMAVGVILAWRMMISIFKNQRDLASLPKDR